jgi:hypothetical protein
MTSSVIFRDDAQAEPDYANQSPKFGRPNCKMEQLDWHRSRAGWWAPRPQSWRNPDCRRHSAQPTVSKARGDCGYLDSRPVPSEGSALAGKAAR